MVDSHEISIVVVAFASGVWMGVWAMVTRFQNKTRFNDGKRKRVRNDNYRLN